MLLTEVINEASVIFEEVITRHHQLTYKSKAIKIFMIDEENTFLTVMTRLHEYISAQLSVQNCWNKKHSNQKKIW